MSCAPTKQEIVDAMFEDLKDRLLDHLNDHANDIIDLLWSVLSLRQREVDERFDIAAIHRTDF